MELHEFHVRDAAAGAPGHRDAVAGAAVGIGRIEIDAPRPAAGDHHGLGAEQADMAGPAIQRIGADAAAQAAVG